MRVASVSWWLVACCATAALGAMDSEPSLVAAVKARHADVVQALLEQRADVNAPAPDGTTALHWAVRADEAATVRLLLGAGANAKAADRYGITPLVLAATNGNRAVIEMLIAGGADPNAEQPDGETALMTAARTGKVDAVAALVAHGAKVDARERSLGETALIWAAAENHAGAVQLLARAGADPNGRSWPHAQIPIPRRAGGTFAHVAAPLGGWTPLMYAARQGALDAARALAGVGADLNATDSEGSTPLLLAIVNAHYDLAAMLLETGADPNVADMQGMAALYAAVDMHSLPWVFGRPAPRTADAVDSLRMATMLLDRGADPNGRLKGPTLQRHATPGDVALGEGATAFMRAAKAGDLVMMRLLLNKGADPRLTQKNGTTALIMAAGLGFRKNSLDDDALDRGTESDAIAAITLCLDLGLDVNAFNEDGQTPLHAAVGRGDQVIAFLVERGARLDMKDRKGRTPLDLALRGTAQEVRGGVRETTVPLLRQLMDKAGVSSVSPR